MKKFSFWPWGIVVVFLLFVAVQIVVLIISGSVNNDLVTDNYYEKELVYQQQIDRRKRGRMAENILEFRQDIPGQLVLQYPEKKEKLSGVILFFRPDDRSKDFKTTVKPDTNARQIIYLEGLEKGLWKVKAFWNDARQDYFAETALVIR
jgi:hypothetical protein